MVATTVATTIFYPRAAAAAAATQRAVKRRRDRARGLPLPKGRVSIIGSSWTLDRRGRACKATKTPEEGSDATTAAALVVIEHDARMRERVSNAARVQSATPNRVDEFVLHEELTERKIAWAVRANDFELAKALKEEGARREQELSPSAQLAAALARRLRDPNSAETEVICADIVQLGDRRLVPSLLRALCTVDADNEAVSQAIEHAIWMLWQKSGNLHYDARLLDGIRAMSIVPDGLPMARDIFTEIMDADPGFAEAHNKRATVNYLMQLYDLSIKDCENVLILNPQHFGAHSGKGLCHLALHQYQDALNSFENALLVNPKMEHVQRYKESLQSMLEKSQRKHLRGD